MCDSVQDMKALRTGLQIQQAALRALVESVDRKFQVFKGRFDEIVDGLDALALGANRLRGDVTQDQPINRLVPAYNYRQPIYGDNFVFADHI